MASEAKADDTSDRTTDTTYHYKPLDDSTSQIRLLRLLPSEDKIGPLRASLHTACLSPTPPNYEALSYMWGDTTMKYPLHVGDKILDITQNLFDALRRVRYPDEPRILWVDAICMNQSCDEEKNHQVGQMFSIYSSASRVLIWLGEGDQDSDYAMENLRNLHQTPCEFLKPSMIEAVEQRPWWSRIWTLQEGVAASPDSLVLCGDKSVPWETVNSTIAQFQGLVYSYYLNKPMLSGHHRIRFRRGKGEKVTLEELLITTTHRAASDPRDRVYALLNLVSDPSFERFEADYSRPVGWAFQMAMISVCICRRDLDWLVNAVREGGTLKPSWCANFSLPFWGRSPGFHQNWMPRLVPYQAGATARRNTFTLQHDPDKGTIKQPGAVIGRINFARPPVCEAAIWTWEERRWLEIDAMCKVLLDIRFLSRTALETWTRRMGAFQARSKIREGHVWKTAMGGHDLRCVPPPPRYFPPGNPEYGVIADKLVRGLSAAVRIDDASHPDFSMDLEAGGGYHTCVQMLGQIKGNRFFTTDTHYIGMASQNIQVGDLVCILFGCKYPVVLRPSGDEGYRLVTVAYVDDVMEGEFFKTTDTVEEREFLIK